MATNNTSDEEKAKAHETAKAFADNLGFDEQQRIALTGFLNAELASMESEDPEGWTWCSCHGTAWQNKDVDAWGLCPDGRRGQ